ncbi:hypothetical protein AMTRI_Chr13g117930 [Amborella trichopoda]|uniref:Uncharacterized protein n=1 Tax=Amborella trichopoda TaxID=13333 RepID=W1NXW6_AMBTC|nr:hypothetical protein AMTR_s00213p00019970 [Amborella trichopoda]
MQGWRLSPLVVMVLVLLAIHSDMGVAQEGRRGLSLPPPKPNGNVQWKPPIPMLDPLEPQPPPPPAK